MDLEYHIQIAQVKAYAHNQTFLVVETGIDIKSVSIEDYINKYQYVYKVLAKVYPSV